MSPRSEWFFSSRPTLWLGSFLSYLLRAVVTTLLLWMSVELVDEFNSANASSSWLVAQIRVLLMDHPVLRRWVVFPESGLWILWSFTAILFLLFAFSSRRAPRLARESARIVISDLRAKLARSLLGAQSSGLQSIAELSSRLTSELDVLKPALESRAEFLFLVIPLGALLTLFTLYILPGLTAICWTAAGLMFTVSLGPIRRFRVEHRRADSAARFYENDIHDLLHTLRSVKAMSLEGQVLDHLEKREDAEAAHLMTSDQARASLSSWTVVVSWTARLAWVGVVVHAGLNGVFAIELSVNCGRTSSRCLAEASVARPLVERLQALIEDLEARAETEGSQNTSSVPLPDSQILTFDQVELRGEPAHKIDAEFSFGELIVVSGADAARLSYFGRLLNRLDEPEAGKIMMGKTDIRRFRLHLLRQLVTWIGREAFFVYGSIRENLLLASTTETDPDDQRISEALHHAGVDFIADLPENIETVIGEGGYKINRAEATKLNIARAFLRRDTRIYFFDRVGDDLDEDSREFIFNGLRELTQRGALVFWVSRRFEEARRADRVLVFGDHEAPLLGTHVELLTHGPRYLNAFQSNQDAISELEFIETAVEPEVPEDLRQNLIDETENIEEKSGSTLFPSKDL